MFQEEGMDLMNFLAILYLLEHKIFTQLKSYCFTYYCSNNTLAIIQQMGSLL